MLVLPAPLLICPHDGGVLAPRGNSLSCPAGHTFDRAREGYVNLLPVQNKASSDPGDSKEMVAARQRFLETDAFGPIAAAVAEHTLDAIDRSASDRPFAILDAGCGEGYYLAKLAARLASETRTGTVHLAGIDISKWAVRAAAKRSVAATWAVASNRRPPLPPSSIDLILCLFGFPLWDGFGAVQPLGGEVLLIDPGPDHLLELREIIYPEVRRQPRVTPRNLGPYSLVDERRIQAAAHLPSQSVIADLLSMTPHAHRGSVTGKAALAERAVLDTRIDVVLRVFRRTL